MPHAPLWAHLFDPGEIEHACAALVEQVTHAFPSCTALTDTIDRYLLRPLAFYIDDVGGLQSRTVSVMLANQLYVDCSSLTKAIKRSQRAKALSIACKLEAAWKEFALVGAAHHIYHDLPREIERNREVGRSLTRARIASANEKAERVRKAASTLVARDGMTWRQASGKLQKMRVEGLSARRIRDIVNKPKGRR